MTNTPSRFDWVDSLKGFAILAVVLGHTDTPVAEFIFSWHMPFFFMISGFFIKHKIKISDHIQNDFKRLMIPYFIFSLLGLGVETLKRIALQRPALDFFPEIFKILYQMNYSSSLNHYGFVLWFLPALFVGKLLYHLIFKFSHGNYFLVLLASLLIFQFSFELHLPFAIDQGMNCLIWLTVGNLIFLGIKNAPIQWPLLIVMVGILAIASPHAPHLNIALKDYSNRFLNLLWPIGFLTFMIGLLQNKSCPNSLTRFFSFFGKESMIIFVFHPYTNNIAHLLNQNLNTDLKYLDALISIGLLMPILIIKKQRSEWGVFKYV